MGYGTYGTYGDEAGGSQGAVYFDALQCLDNHQTSHGLRPWTTVNVEQGWLMAHQGEIRIEAPIGSLKTDEVFTQEPEEARAFFVKHDMEHLADDIGEMGPDDYVAAVYNQINSVWNFVGKRKRVYTKQGEEFESGELPGATVFRGIPGYAEDVGSVQAGELTYFFAVADAKTLPLKGTELFAAVKTLVESTSEAETTITGTEDENVSIQIPAVDDVFASDIGWLEGMHTSNAAGRKYRIKKAGQLIRLRLNHRGAKVKVGAFVRGAFERINGPILTIDKTFVIAIVCPKQNNKLLGAFLATPGTWVKPGSPEARKLDEEE